MQPTAHIRNAQRQCDTIEHDGQKPQRQPHDQAEVCWKTRGTSTLETTTRQQHLESTGATATNATAAADALQHDAAAYDATANDAATNDANAATSSIGHKHDKCLR